MITAFSEQRDKPIQHIYSTGKQKATPMEIVHAQVSPLMVDERR